MSISRRTDERKVELNDSNLHVSECETGPSRKARIKMVVFNDKIK